MNEIHNDNGVSDAREPDPVLDRFGVTPDHDEAESEWFDQATTQVFADNSPAAVLRAQVVAWARTPEVRRDILAEYRRASRAVLRDILEHGTQATTNDPASRRAAPDDPPADVVARERREATAGRVEYFARLGSGCCPVPDCDAQWSASVTQADHWPDVLAVHFEFHDAAELAAGLGLMMAHLVRTQR